MSNAKGVFTPHEILSTKITQPPICPFCHDAMIREHIEMHDGSGWIHCWTCDCEPPDNYAEYTRCDLCGLYKHETEMHKTGDTALCEVCKCERE